MKYELGDWTRRLSLCLRSSECLDGLRRSTARERRVVRAGMCGRLERRTKLAVEAAGTEDLNLKGEPRGEDKTPCL